ncbi:hypothetical protein L6452_39323 [Arctium lappa]|uniref:Uncharacterized protein n=1 Tax=Arctium lappa TaxID=4217 RepID=A0ACB8XRB6_ARCLA|nr:hypothetical protein L6452_39323 [Arctium lappa]
MKAGSRPSSSSRSSSSRKSSDFLYHPDVQMVERQEEASATKSAHLVAVQPWWVFESPSTSVASSSGGSLVSSISIWVSINTFKILGQRLSIWV